MAPSLVPMKAVVISGGKVSWDERPAPVPGPFDLLVRVMAAGVNRADLLQRAGRYPAPPGVPQDQPGLECAGTVEAVGPHVRSFAVGDPVMALVPGAAQAELAAVHERLAMAVPAGMSPVQAGAFPEAFATAHDALFTQAGLGPGERLLVTGAAGGVGTAAVQLGLAAGASVVASARHPDSHPRLSSLGALCTLPDHAPSLGPFDVVLELVGAPSFAPVLGSLAPGGRVVVIGTGGGTKCDLDLGVLMARRATVKGSTLRSRPLEERAMVVRRTEHHVAPLVARGAVKVFVEAEFAFERAQDAYERFASGPKLGKIVLRRD